MKLNYIIILACFILLARPTKAGVDENKAQPNSLKLAFLDFSIDSNSLKKSTQQSDSEKSKKGKLFMEKILTPVIYRLVAGKEIEKVYRIGKDSKKTEVKTDPLSMFWVFILLLVVIWVVAYISSGYLSGRSVNLLLIIVLLSLLWVLGVV